jgi:hypothetical protein
VGMDDGGSLGRVLGRLEGTSDGESLAVIVGALDGRTDGDGDGALVVGARSAMGDRVIGVDDAGSTLDDSSIMRSISSKKAIPATSGSSISFEPTTLEAVRPNVGV